MLVEEVVDRFRRGAMAVSKANGWKIAYDKECRAARPRHAAAGDTREQVAQPRGELGADSWRCAQLQPGLRISSIQRERGRLFGGGTFGGRGIILAILFARDSSGFVVHNQVSTKTSHSYQVPWGLPLTGGLGTTLFPGTYNSEPCESRRSWRLGRALL
jgi:hypothetical protein